MLNPNQNPRRYANGILCIHVLSFILLIITTPRIFKLFARFAEQLGGEPLPVLIRFYSIQASFLLRYWWLCLLVYTAAGFAARCAFLVPRPPIAWLSWLAAGLSPLVIGVIWGLWSYAYCSWQEGLY